jgi:hypothetical protein
MVISVIAKIYTVIFGREREMLPFFTSLKRKLKLNPTVNPLHITNAEDAIPQKYVNPAANISIK